MADILLDHQSVPATPSSGKSVLFFDSTSLNLYWKDATGRTAGHSENAAIAAQGAGFATDTYVTNSDILIPTFSFQAKTVFRWTISASKTGAGTAAPVYTIRIGAARSTSDTSRLALTGPAQTAIADIGTLTILVTVRSVGASGVIQGTAYWTHRGTAANTTTSGTGFANDSTGHVEGTSSGFDNSNLGGNYIGLSINGGTSASWTLTQCIAEALW
jgi:hypothetical protein